MSYEAYLTVTFQKSIKILKKKFRSVKDDLYGVIRTLEKDPTIGDPIPGWNKELVKLRLKPTSRGGTYFAGEVNPPIKYFFQLTKHLLFPPRYQEGV